MGQCPSGQTRAQAEREAGEYSARRELCRLAGGPGGATANKRASGGLLAPLTASGVHRRPEESGSQSEPHQQLLTAEGCSYYSP